MTKEELTKLLVEICEMWNIPINANAETIYNELKDFRDSYMELYQMKPQNK